jgi:hypothetical protein
MPREDLSIVQVGRKENAIPAAAPLLKTLDLRRQTAPTMAAFNNLVLGLLLPRGVTNLPDAQREFNADPKNGRGRDS